MVRWMVTILLRLAPDMEEDPLEDKNNNEEESFGFGIGAQIVSESMITEIKFRAKLLFEKLKNLTDILYGCCAGIVKEKMQEMKAQGDEMADLEVKDLEKMKVCLVKLH